MTLDFLNHNSYKTHILYYHISLDIMRHRGDPEWSQDGPKMPKMAQDVPKMAQDGPKMAQDGPKMAQDIPPVVMVGSPAVGPYASIASSSSRASG